MYGGQRQNIWNLMYGEVERHTWQGDHNLCCVPDSVMAVNPGHTGRKRQTEIQIKSWTKTFRWGNRQTDIDLYVVMMLRCKADRKQSGIYWLQQGAPSTAIYNYGSATWHFVPVGLNVSRCYSSCEYTISDMLADTTLPAPKLYFPIC